ncbi:MAG: 4-aminobutyrate aminotransferase-like enzyme/Ser/Thr protein kinase RdoA (MazF antagonist) [Parvicellaceae bacterium]|jgi:4-aminobutyrate aminotransferase-like enzyme/Ser/Thr protein kinase RdoA (MazF antagonist)
MAMNVDYQSIKIELDQAAIIAKSLYGWEGELKQLPGEVDFNFWLKSESDSYLLKISRPDEDIEFLAFQQELLQFIENSEESIIAPITHPDKEGKFISEITDEDGIIRKVRLLSWIDGRLWSSVNPIKSDLLNSLGTQAGKLTKILSTFKNEKAHRHLEWDVAKSGWTSDYVILFNERQREIATYFQNNFEKFQEEYQNLRKSIVHNDVNDNNIVVSDDLINPDVKSIIDFGDAVYTQTINDLAVTLAYAIMHQPDPLNTATSIVRGYNDPFPLMENELKHLYTLTAMQLVITVTKSAINKKKEPENTYLIVSEAPAWEALNKWVLVDENIAHYAFREACGYSAHPHHDEFHKWITAQNLSLNDFIPELEFNKVQNIDLSVSSNWLGGKHEYTDIKLSDYKFNCLKNEHDNSIIAGGYGEVRPFYSTNAYSKEGNSGPEYRTVHLGVDFWLDAGTSIHAPLDGKVITSYNNDFDKDYGPTIILQHKTDNGVPFYCLYGHLSKTSLDSLKAGDPISKGDIVATIGDSTENGNWVPHLHLQVMLDLLGNQHNYPGVCYPNEKAIWLSVCPNPNTLFQETGLNLECKKDKREIKSFRTEHLGKSLSLSYDQPLNMVRGQGIHLIDETGRKYLDTVNNVAHVGHEHPRVVKAGQQQMGVLNTNTRYLHQNITDFAEELLATFPDELSVVHFVNSGSEANELAMRMAKVWSDQKDIIAVEIGYHGNTNGCIDISSYKFDSKGGKGAPEHTHIVPLPDTYRGIYQGRNTGPKYAAHVQEQIGSIQTKGRNVAAFICESIISCGGQVELPKDYLKLAYKAVRKAGGLCISDEVQVGLGRAGSHFWGFQLHNVIPDIVTIGKPIGNGHPLAAVVCTKEVAEKFANGMEYFNTFGGNPVSCAIGKEVLRVVKDEKLQENSRVVGNYLKSELNKLQADYPIIGDVRGQGLFLGFELVDSKKNPLPEKATYIANRMKDYAILMSTDGKDNNALKIKPPIIFSKDNADELLARLKTILQEDFMLNYK